MTALSEAEACLRKILSDLKSLAIAFSGGTDSTLLSCIAREQLGNRILLVHVRSVMTSRRETVFAEDWARRNGFRLSILDLDPLSNPAVRENGLRRCYFCKHLIMGEVISEAGKAGFRNVADATNLDDFDDYRPGLDATAELNILHPLSDAGFGKALIRELARQKGLPNADNPAAACLASRIPYGTPLDAAVLERVGGAEEKLSDLGFSGCRVRSFGELAVIEVPSAHIGELVAMRDEVLMIIRECGFRRATVDLAGYRVGSLNPEF